MQVEQHGGHAEAEQAQWSGIASRVFDLSDGFVHVLRHSHIFAAQDARVSITRLCAAPIWIHNIGWPA